MPLQTGDSPEAFHANIRELTKVGGRSRAQILAIAFRVRREGRKKKKPESK